MCNAINTVGNLQESENVRIDGTVACGRSGQSKRKNDLLLEFASRVCDGTARPFETTYMLALMAQDIPE